MTILMLISVAGLVICALCLLFPPKQHEEVRDKEMEEAEQELADACARLDDRMQAIAAAIKAQRGIKAQSDTRTLH